MAFNPAPSAWIENYALTDGVMQIPVASLPKLTSAEAHATTGDIRKLLYALFHQLNAAYAAKAAADRPARMVLTGGLPSVVDEQTLRAVFAAQFDLAVGDADVAAE
jgi:hypothetical protein